MSTLIRTKLSGQHAKRRARQAGGIGVIFALAVVPLIAFAGLAVDFGRALLYRNQLAYSLDAAALAVGSSIGTKEQLEDRMDAFLSVNFGDIALADEVDFDFEIDGELVTAEASLRMPTTFMAVLGRSYLDINVDTEIRREINGLEIALVLDVTGSMAGSKIADLRVAAQALVDVVFGDDPEPLPEFLRVAIVPYSAAVNLGDEAPSVANTSWMESFMPADIGLDPDNPEYSFTSIDYDPDDPLMWKGCVEARQNPHDVEDTSAMDGGSWRPYYWINSLDNNWATASTNNNNSAGNNMRGPNIGCPTPILPLTNVKGDIDNAIDDLEAWSRGGTMGNIGMIWGWRVLSPEPPFDQGLPYDEPLWDKAVVMMTDGDNQMYKWPNIRDHDDTDGDGSTTDNVNNSFYDSDYGSYQRVEDGALGTTNKNTANGRLDDRLEDVCENIKTTGIIVFTITFGSG
ncbi:MAG: TadE/TadG family type IV pilus assembly protein, partial [Pseudomonadota bacterium]